MRGKLMRLMTREQHLVILSNFPSNREAAEAYTAHLKQPISRQLVRYWRQLFQVNEGNLAKTDRELVRQRVLRNPQPDDDVGDLSHIPAVAERILVIPDTHCPYQHPDMFEFLAYIKDKLNPDLVIHAGDEADNHALSFHDSDPNLDSAGTELEKAKVQLQKLHDMFPNLLICHSNHGSLVYRKAKHTGIPVQMIKAYREILFPSHHAPGWSWGFEWIIQTATGPILFKHQAAGDALADAAHQGMSVVVGHEHSKQRIDWSRGLSRRYFGVYSGALIDDKALAFAYAKYGNKKSGTGVVGILGGVPTIFPMLLDEEGRWIRRAKK